MPGHGAGRAGPIRGRCASRRRSASNTSLTRRSRSSGARSTNRTWTATSPTPPPLSPATTATTAGARSPSGGAPPRRRAARPAPAASPSAQGEPGTPGRDVERVPDERGPAQRLLRPAVEGGHPHRQVHLTADVVASLLTLDGSERAGRLAGAPGLEHERALGDGEAGGQPDGSPGGCRQLEDPGDGGDAAGGCQHPHPPGAHRAPRWRAGRAPRAGCPRRCAAPGGPLRRR